MGKTVGKWVRDSRQVGVRCERCWAHRLGVACVDGYAYARLDMHMRECCWVHRLGVAMDAYANLHAHARAAYLGARLCVAMDAYANLHAHAHAAYLGARLGVAMDASTIATSTIAAYLHVYIHIWARALV